jgi:hypothetical protein
MRNSFFIVFALLGQLFIAAEATAQPVTGSGAETLWSAPQEGAIVDVAAGTEKSVSLRGARRLPERGWLTATLRPGEVAWIHLDEAETAVRFAFLRGGIDGAAAVETIPEPRGRADFLVTAPPTAGPQNRLALQVRAGQKPPRAQIWIASIKSPRFRWELWEEQAKRWAKKPTTTPPEPPDLVAAPIVERLALIQDAVALALTESGRPHDAAAAALLQAEALLANLPLREPVFPFYTRKDLTGELARARKLEKIEGQPMVEVLDAQPLTFTLEGPSFLRIEARSRFDKNVPHRSTPLSLVLHADQRPLGLAAEELLPIKPEDPAAEQSPLSSLRRITLAAAPGRHQYELRLRGGPAWVSVISHPRAIHAEQLASHSEDIPRLLERARESGSSGNDLITRLVDAEAAFLTLDDARAAAGFSTIAEQAQHPRLRAFARLRLAALSPSSVHAEMKSDRALTEALQLVGNTQDPADRRLRSMLVAEHLSRRIAEREPGTAATPEALALLHQHPDALTYMPALVGPLLRYVPGPRSLALPLLAEAHDRSPLNDALRHYLTREWFSGTRWAALPAIEVNGAQPVDLVSPPAQLTTCEEAVRQGARGYAPLSEKDAVLEVPQSLAPASSLHRFHLFSLRQSAPRVAWADVTLDGHPTRMPLLLSRERLPVALAAGRHTLRATVAGEKPGSLLAPCALLQQPSNIALLMDHRFSALSGRGAHARVELPGAGTPGFLGVELRADAALRGGRLLLRTDQGTLGHIDVDGRGLDPQVVGMAIGPAILVVLRLPAGARVLDIIREDNGKPLLARALLRRSLANPDRIAPPLPNAQALDPAALEELRQATRARRAAREDAAQARAQVRRAEILRRLGALALARIDAQRALPRLADTAAQERTHVLIATLNEPSLILPRPDGARGLILAAGAGLAASAGEESCVTQALVAFAREPARGQAAVERCGGSFGRYAAARIFEQSGVAEAAARHYAAAYLSTVADGTPYPGLAREAALRYAERGPGPGSREAMALATAAAQSDDPDGERAIEHVRGLVHTAMVHGVDAGPALRTEEANTTPPSLRAALADVPWEQGRFLEVRAGKTAETDFEVKQPLRLRIDLLCDDGGEPAAVAITPPCELRVEVDGAAVGDARTKTLQPGEPRRLEDIALSPGRHRVQVSLPRRHAAPGPSDGALAYVRLATSRALAAGARGDGDGYFAVPILPPPMQRFQANAQQPVRLRILGPTVLRIDALSQRGADKRAIAVEVGAENGAVVRRVYPICAQPADRQAAIREPGFDCRSLVMVPLIHAGTYQIGLQPVGTPSVALGISLVEDEPTDSGEPFRKPPAPLLATQDSALSPSVNPALQGLSRPDSNLLRGLGTLQVQTLGFIRTAGDGDPRLADKYSETAIFYRRKLDAAPVWFKAGALLHLREGPAAFGLSGRIFARIPVIELRVSGELTGFTQSVAGTQAYALGWNSFLERSFQLVPHLFLLPMFGFSANYQSLDTAPPISATTGGMAEDGASVSMAAAAIDTNVYNRFDAAHRTALYGQTMLWWVPFINMIVYGRVRLTSSPSVRQLDSVRGRFGFDLMIRTTEIVSYYDIAQFLVDEVRTQAVLQHRLGLELGQTIWLNRNHRLALFASGNVEVTSRSTTWIFGLSWEGSRGRGLDDYSRPEMNLPQQLSQGRGTLRPEETLR